MINHNVIGLWCVIVTFGCASSGTIHRSVDTPPQLSITIEPSHTATMESARTEAIVEQDSIEDPSPAEDFTYCLNSKGTIRITGYKGTNNTVVIPSIIDGIAVTEIGNRAFYQKKIQSITIPYSIERIEQAAFTHNQTLKAVNVSVRNRHYASVDGTLFSKDKTILYRVPAGKSLTSYTIPDGVTTIEYEALYGHQLTTVTIPESVTYIGWSAFAYNYLTTIDIPDNVLFIGRNAFAHNQLTKVTCGNNLREIRDLVFEGNRSLTAIEISTKNQQYTSVDGMLFSKDKTVLYIVPDGKDMAAYRIPSTVNTIGDWAFYHSTVSDVIIPDSVSTIGTYAFRSSRLNRITVGADKDYINSEAGFDKDFINYYQNHNRKAGTYIKTGKTWTLTQ
ncbi:MAG: leucine-rich repeat domain-containing protein [Treponema sp.]|nr:leucine-rich repeat domain-containing protein [Treponema sp.]